MNASDKEDTGSTPKSDVFEGNNSNSDSIDAAIRYLIAHQREDGGWGEFDAGETTVYATSLVSLFLGNFQQTHRLTDSLSRAISYILKMQDSEGKFGSSPMKLQETALASLALSGKAEGGSVKKALDFLLARQLADGSWNSDPVSTILAAAALSAANMQKVEDDSMSERQPEDNPDTKAWIPSSDTGAVKGQIIDVSTGAPITGTTILVKSDPQVKDISDELGYFLIRDVAPGPQRIKVMTSDYMQQVILIDVDRGSVADLGVISLAPLSAFEFVDFGKNPNEGEPERESARKDQKRKVSLAIRRKRGYDGDHEGSKLLAYINGNVFDLITKKPISQASVEFSGRPAVATDDQGVFFIKNVEPGECRITISRNGYREQIYAGPINAGQVKDIIVYLTPEQADIALKPSIQESIENPGWTQETACSTADVMEVKHERIEREPQTLIELKQTAQPSVLSMGMDDEISLKISLKGIQRVAGPTLLSVLTNSSGDRIILSFDKVMSQPDGKHSCFVTHVNGEERSISAALLNKSDHTKIDLIPSTPIMIGQAVSLSCIAGGITSSNGLELSSFSEYPVVNNTSPLFYAQDGFGFSGLMARNPLSETVFMSGFSQWPSGFYKNVLAFMGGVYDGGHIWMIPANADSVVRIDKDTGMMKSYNKWPAGFRKGNLSFEGGVFDGRYIWMIPANAESVVRIDKDTGEMTEYNNWPADFKKGGHAFAGGVFDGQCVWMIPSYAESVIKIDAGTGVMTAYSKWPESFKKGGYAFAGGVFDGRYIWMIPANADSVVKIDKDTGEMTEHNNWPADFKKGGHAFAGGVFDGQRIWMVPYYADRVITIDHITGNMDWCNQRSAEFTNVEYAFTGGVFDGENVWLIPLNADCLVRINTKTGSITKLNQWPAGFSKGVNAFSGGVFDGENVWMIPSSADKVIRFSSFSPSSVSANITSNDSFYLYISQDESIEGLFVGQGNSWSSIYSLNSKLVPGVTNYLHVKGVDQSGPIAAFIGDFTLNDPNFYFENHTQHCVTGEDGWIVCRDKFGGIREQVSAICKNGMGKWSTRFGIDLNAQWIWTNWGKDFGTRYFSTPIYYSTGSEEILRNVRVMNTLPATNVTIDKDSFNKKPNAITDQGEKILIEWQFESMNMNEIEDLSFNLRVRAGSSGCQTPVSDSVEVFYEDSDLSTTKMVLGPCMIDVIGVDDIGQSVPESVQEQVASGKPDQVHDMA
ncbi:MAG TPA: carboxypeptidase regulatory-like domain-containing protein, partial [Syntrophorhabdaceae bacterium]|nr:carboxypeptidase regulatory-like domain-containing protein [Syntrophorhabdaceae bacterium]